MHSMWRARNPDNPRSVAAQNEQSTLRFVPSASTLIWCRNLKQLTQLEPDSPHITATSHSLIQSAHHVGNVAKRHRQSSSRFGEYFSPWDAWRCSLAGRGPPMRLPRNKCAETSPRRLPDTAATPGQGGIGDRFCAVALSPADELCQAVLVGEAAVATTAFCVPSRTQCCRFTCSSRC